MNTSLAAPSVIGAIILACAHGAIARTTAQGAVPTLGGTAWQLVKFQGSDDKTLTPDDRAKYTITFGADGSLTARIDCNRGRGTWKSSDSGQLQLAPLALTRAMCPFAALNDRIAKDWTFVRSYVIRDGHLFLSLMADGGIYEFEPILGGRAQEPVAPQRPSPPLAGSYSELDRRRQQLIENWVARFTEATGQQMEAGPFYDTHVKLSARTTFEAVTHALMTTPLTDSSGATLGDGLDLVDRVDTVRGEVAGASGDRQFRMYVRLTPNALDVLGRSREFRRGVDNSVYHKGYPLNYREQGGVPSIQISVAQDGRQADIDVDYRASSFPASLFNGHLTASNSDVRAGNNYDRHVNRWTGFQNWWRSFFGIGLQRAPDDVVSDRSQVFANTPRAGKKNVDVMMDDFLRAWLVDADLMGAMSYISERAYACVGQDGENPLASDRGMAPVLLMTGLKAAQESLGKRESLEGLSVGVRLTTPGLRLVNQAHHAQFVLYAVPDDVAAAFDCESRLTLGDPSKIRRAYGNYFGATFYINGPRRNVTLALLWAKERGYWKIVSWRAEPEEEDTPVPDVLADRRVVRIKAEASFVEAARGFLESWLIRKDYEAAFRYLSPKSYACYDLIRSPDQPAAISIEDAGQQIRTALESAGQAVGKPRSLDALLSAAEPFHPAIRVMDHPYSRTFTLSSLPNVFAGAADCAARARGEQFTGEIPLEYGTTFGMTVRFRTRSGDAPVLRTMWLKENGAWRLTVYSIELP